MTYSKSFLDDLKSRFRLSDAIGRHVKLTRAGREFKGLSPFTNEKTPSFFVNDEKGFYHCFSSGESGDLLSFFMKTQRLSFNEAVKLLADEAGVELPRQTDDERQRDRERASLLDVMEMAAQFYRQELARREGASARTYLADRGLKDNTIQAFGLGYAPRGRTALHDHLLQKDVTPDQIVQAGLAIQPDDNQPLYDRFRHRIIFPIADFKGRVIAFGGRALDSNVSAKYLNSPETPLFHKGAVLYNFKTARESCYRSVEGSDRVLIVAEGYMDVISLVEAGFTTAVAPLGTALTDTQLHTLWRVCPEPILCFDGDHAGLSAANRIVDRALPSLKPGHSLRFALLPEGQDPDDIIRAGGPHAMTSFLTNARPLADMLWERELSIAPYDTPERRAGLESRLGDLIRTIRERRVQDHYRADFKARLAALFRRDTAAMPVAGQRFFDGRRPWIPGESPVDSRGISPQLRRSKLTTTGNRSEEREALLILAILNHPGLLDSHFEGFAEVSLLNAKLDRLRNEILRIASGESLDRAALANHLSGTSVADIARELRGRNSLGKDHPFARPEAQLAEVERGWSHLINLHWDADKLAREQREAEDAFGRDMTDENFARLVAIRAQKHAAEQKEKAKAAEVDKERTVSHSK